MRQEIYRMRVENQQNQNIVELMQQTSCTRETKEAGLFGNAGKTSETGVVSGTSVNVRDVTYLNPAKDEQKTVVDEIEQGQAMDATERKNQMAVLANTTSEEDYTKMQEQGFSLDETTTNTIVTVTDKIKAELAKAGVDTSCFGDELSADQIEAITGSPELARQLTEAFHQADLPVTKENAQDAMEILAMTGSLTSPSEGAVKYLLDNELEPTVENIYMAEYSGSTNYQPAQPVDTTSFDTQIKAVIRSAGLEVNDQTMQLSKWMLENNIPLTPDNLSYAQALNEMQIPTDSEEMMDRIATAVEEGGRPKDAMLLDGYTLEERAVRAEELVASATDEDIAYVLENGMELTLENLAYAAHNTKSGSVDGTSAVQGIAGTDGASAAQGTAGADAASDVTEGTEAQGETAAQTADVTGEYTRDGLSLITARRQLEELRLVMTAQANYSLLRQGISIETKPLEELVDELKNLEQNYYKNLLASENIDTSDENVLRFEEITRQVTEIKYVPAYVLGTKEADVSTIHGVHKAGTALKDSFERANERYETLMTAPRADLGDSIQKAFRNVDGILTDLELDNSEENRRAVRILGYNGLDITAESVTEMKAADEEVQRAFKNMTPSVVMEMIRRGINPLQMDFAELNQTAEQIKSETMTGEDTAKYSEYLWKLEQNHSISEDERSSYIGIYRLMRQVENTDGAAIGALVNQGTELTMKNLLTAVRSEKKSGRMEYEVDDNFAGVEKNEQTASITSQIEAAYQQNCLKDVLDTITPEKLKNVLQQTPDWEAMTPEQLKQALAQVEDSGAETYAYAKEQLSELEQAANVTEDIYQVLDKYDIPNTMSNVLAMEQLVNNRNQMFRKIFGSGVKSADEKVGTEDLEQIKEELLEEFGEAVSEPVDMAIAQEKLGELAENVMKTMINSDDVTSVDIREMRMLSAQLSVSSMLAKEEQYCVPVMVNDEMMNVSVKIVRGVDKKGIVDIMMDSELRGKIAATFQAKENGIQGLVATDNRETQELLEHGLTSLAEQLAGENDTVLDLHSAYLDDLDLNHFSNGMYGVNADSSDIQEPESEGYKVQTSRLYHIAESFIKNIKETL